MSENVQENSIKGREKVFEKLLDKYENKGSKYDYLLLFSGGKDSTYLAHTVKKLKGKKVCLFTVDNGFEEENFLNHVKKVADDLELDHCIYKASEHDFERLYSFTIREKMFREIDPNPVCFLCGYFITALGVEFAEKNNIPAVIHGMSPTQYNLQLDVKFDDVNDIAFERSVNLLEKIRFKKMHNIYELVKNVDVYRSDAILKNVVDRIFYKSDKVDIILPFLFMEYNVENIKKTIEDELGWTNIFGVDNSLYISSGCRMFNICLLLEKKIPGFRVKEKGEYEKDYKNGSVSEEAYSFIMGLAKDFDENCEITEDMKAIVKRVGIEDIIYGG